MPFVLALPYRSSDRRALEMCGTLKRMEKSIQVINKHATMRVWPATRFEVDYEIRWPFNLI